MVKKVKANAIVIHEIKEDGSILFAVRDAGVFTFTPSKCSAAIVDRAALHGFVQRISDGAAISRDPETGVAATAGDKLARMQRIAEHMESGTDNWNLVVASGGQTEGGLVVLAMVRAGLGTNVDEANEKVARLMAKRTIERAAALAVWANTTQVAEALAAIRAERAAKKAAEANVDADDLLAEMEEDLEEAPF